MYIPRRLLRPLARFVIARRLLEGGVQGTHIDIRVRCLPPQLDGFRIAHISDLHVGDGNWVPGYADEAARLVKRIGANVVANTGDYLQGTPSMDKVTAVAQSFVSNGDPRSPQASLGILGNHDYYAGDETVAELTERLQATGMQVLVNRSQCVRHNGAEITFAGLTRDAPGFDQAVDELLASSRPRVVLVHQPDLAEELPENSADLVLAGHTHGGQISLPGLEKSIVRRFCGSEYVHGLYQVNGMPVYVNRGLGCTGVPIRFRARPEVTTIRLVR
jgi:uncharacterized protein